MNRNAVYSAMVATVLVTGSVLAQTAPGASAQGPAIGQSSTGALTATQPLPPPPPAPPPAPPVSGVLPAGSSGLGVAANCVVCIANAPFVVGSFGVVAGGVALTLSGTSSGFVQSSTSTGTTTPTTTTSTTTTTTKKPATTTTTTTTSTTTTTTTTTSSVKK